MGQSGGKMPGNLQLAKGEPRPKGCCESPKGGEVNFTIDAPGRGSVWLYLLLPEGHEGASTLEGVDSSGGELYVQLDPSTNKTGDTWHVKLTLPGGFDPKGAKYMWILDPKLDQHGLPEANAVRILDPCAKCLDSRYAKDWNKRGGPKFSPMAVVPDRRAIYEFDWQGVKPPNLHLKDLVIYEAHVRGFTRNPDSKLQDWDATAGTFLGFIQKIPHLLKLGINAVELLPVYEFDETACPRKNPENGEQLCNFWGYSTVNFFVPMQRFSSRDRIGAAIVGFKTLVRELHRQGIEVILDVVFNHTAEGAWGEHFWHSWAAIAKNRYYILSNGQDTNYTGCGNTVNANDPMCSDWIVECLSYWVDEMHVDGFRFDLASALTRGNDGKVSMDPLLIKKMANEPKLKRAKFIAEAWDCSWPDGYLVGKFPSGGPPRWAEWNGIFRDTIRCFIKGDEGKKGDFATRICGSSDLFKHNGRKPFHSINFITAHDGFTLKDLVSYNGKHNTCNGENSGDDHNNSWNCGHEGDTGDGGVNHLRSRQIRNFMVALFMSAGTPMILYGDEYGRSQRGCNNGWCQDARCWFSWSDSEKQENNLMRFVRLLISLRKQYAGIFNREEFMSNKDIWWRVHWDDPYNYICYVLHDHHATGQGYAGLMVAFNAGHEVRCCDLPQDKPWYRIIDTNLPAPKDICENEASSVKITSQSYVMQPYSCIVLKTYSDKKSIKEYARTDAEYGAHQDINRHMKEVIKRRMSMEFTSSTGTPHIQDIGKRQSNEAMERMQSMVRMRSLMSGAFMDAIEEGESLETKKEEAFQPPPRKPSREQVQKKPSKLPLPAKPATGGEGAKVIDTDLGDKRVEAILYPDGAEGRVLEVRAKGFGGGELIFHWGLIESFGAGWSNAPEQVCNASWPDKTKTFPGANQTVFSDAEDDGFRRVMIPFPRNVKVKAVNFVLHQPPKGWHKPGHQDFTAEWPQAESLFSAAADRATEAESGKSVRTTRWKVRGGNLMGVGAVWAEGALVHFVTDLDTELMLHYGPGDAYNKWVFARSENFRSAPEDGVLRGSALFALSLILKRLEPQLRSIAQLPPWQMISAVDHPVQGELVSVPRMLHMQDKIFETPTIMLSGLVSGEEEVPVGVQAVLVRDAKSAPDILSHCAVRARNSGVLLASCYDSTLTEKIEAELLGQWVQVVCSADGSVEIKAAERPMADPKRMRMMARSASRDLTQELMSKETDSTKLVNMNLKEDFGCKWVVTPEKMDKSKVGSKSLNLALLKPQLPKDILTPQAVAMPYGSMQKALTSRENAKEWLSKLEACLAQLQPTSSNEDAKTIFQEAQVYVNALQMPSELDQALRSAMEEVGSKEGEKRLLNLYHRGDAWDATKQVWASLFGLRPWVSLAKAGRSFYDLNMAVLVQELLPAKYAFVLHTKNPFTNDPNEVYGEVVPGRGETLVGNYPGRALSFRARKGETPVVTSFLSKSTLLRTQECLIFRSDSNGEDLEGFAGAGLFESICATSDIPCMVRFHRLRLLTDHSFRQTLLSKLAEAGRAVEKAFGSPQDIEGCVDPQDRIFIVQSRPQV
ncbi:unnamed protein product [Effrenium voratum]|uniref:Glycosyl hydrolase family 13 catalytic domain-containing protein n=1 Tax=Effrenium voratum TaxID=2562239 RepID=A0AA36JR33_9DINO|nr:unnamed protein product [Effrenium voratum]